ncbi:MAG TPA: hypothetical protein VKT20_09285 [Candidatus Dormibacteraeota bacterium]|nr:hypothetical protein [Candidatus Dormibacteraeota bacterium]
MAKSRLPILATAVAGAQAGHLLVYRLRFGASAMQVQASGAHAYFPGLLKTAFGVSALVVLAGFLLVAAAKVVAQGRVPRSASPSYLNLLAALFTLQLVFFAGQEVAESLAAGMAPAPASDLLLWGMLGQLPVALVGAASLRWLWTRVEAAAAVIADVVAATTPVATPVFVPTAAAGEPALALIHASRSAQVKRGPPIASSIAPF